MTMKVLAKAAVSVLVGAGLTVVPAVAGLAPANAAPNSGCEYDPTTATTTDLTVNQPAISAGQAVTGSASVTYPGVLPTGSSLTITRYAYQGSSYAATGTVVATEANTDGALSFSTTSLPGNATYKLVATLDSSNCDYADSTSASKYTTVYKLDTQIEKVEQTSTSITVTVGSTRGDEANSSAAIPSGTVQFGGNNFQGQLQGTCTLDAPTDGGTGTCTLTGSSALINSVQRVRFVPNTTQRSQNFNASLEVAA